MNLPEFLSTLVPVSSEMSKCGIDHFILDLTYCFLQTVSASFTMLLIVSVAIGMLNTSERISWVRLMLTAPTVFNATAND